MGYLYLALAIAGELIGTTYLKYSNGFTEPLPSAISIASYSICYFLFSKALTDINLSVAYATWCAVGVIVTALISVFLFQREYYPGGDRSTHDDNRRRGRPQSLWSTDKRVIIPYLPP